MIFGPGVKRWLYIQHQERLTDKAFRKAAVVALVGLLILGGCTRDGSEARALADLIALTDEPFAFRFRYQAIGTRTRDCFRSNTTFEAEVDQNVGIAIIKADDGRPVAEIRKGASAVAGSAVGVDAVDWLSFLSPVNALAYRDALERALGTDLAPYLLAGDIPPSGRATIEAALEEKTTVTTASRVDLRGRTLGRYDLLLAPEVIDVNGSGAKLTAWLDADGVVVRIVVAAAVQDGEELEHRDGWQIDYSYDEMDRLRSPVTSPRLLGDVDPSELKPTTPDCRLPL